MAYIVHIEFEGKTPKRCSLEGLAHAIGLSNDASKKVIALVFNPVDDADLACLSRYGADEICTLSVVEEVFFSMKQLMPLVAFLLEAFSPTVWITAHNPIYKGLAAAVALKNNAKWVTNILEVHSTSPLELTTSFLGMEAKERLILKHNHHVLTFSKNAIEAIEHVKPFVHRILPFSVSEPLFPSVEEERLSYGALEDAEIVIGGGRGLKGAEHFTMLEDLASLLEAQMACSRAVSDEGWRPHTEHVGQTGKKIAPKIYIAVAISGAVQHIAGIGESKIKIVINKDPDAPFFKVADYGVVGDAFEVIPKMIQLIKEKNLVT